MIFGIQLLKIYYVISKIKAGELDVYSSKPSAKDIWNVLEDQYKDKERLSKSHLSLDDDTEVLPQIKDLEKLEMKLKNEKITLCNAFIFGAIVKKLLPSWMSFSTDIRKRKKQVSLSNLKSFILIEDMIRTWVKNKLLAK